MGDEWPSEELSHHMKFLSKAMLSSPLSWSSLTWVLRCLKIYLLKPETLLFGLCLVVLFVFFHSVELWLKAAVGRIQLAARMPASAAGRSSLPLFGSGAERISWELRQGSAGVYAVQGRRPKMEDRFSVITRVPESDVALYGVFDGHGGESAAEFVEKHLFKSLSGRISQGFAKSPLEQKSLNFPQLIAEEILSVDKELISQAKASKDIAGTTALVALHYANQLIVANVGDSRGVLCDGRGVAIPLSFDHKPQQLKEHKRIKEAGGFIAFNGVWRVAGILATSRALGDYPLKDRLLVIADPDVLTFNLDDMKPQFMILASDGLWDTFSNEEAVAFIKERLDEPHYGAKSITLQAYYRGSVDNITVIVVNFKNGTSVGVQHTS